MMDCKLFTVTDEGTEMGFLAIRLDPDRAHVTNEEAFRLISWAYAPGHLPGYMLLAEVKFGNPVKAGINEHCWDRGGTGYQAFLKILANWDDLQSGDTVDVEQEREAFWEEEHRREKAAKLTQPTVDPELFDLERETAYDGATLIRPS